MRRDGRAVAPLELLQQMLRRKLLEHGVEEWRLRGRLLLYVGRDRSTSHYNTT